MIKTILKIEKNLGTWEIILQQNCDGYITKADLCEELQII